MRVVDARFGEPLPREHHAQQHETGRDQPGHFRSEAARDRADHWTNEHSGARRSGNPAERLRALPRRHRVGDIGLGDAGRSATQALHQTRGEQHPETRGETEDDIRDRRSREPNEHRGPPAVAIGELAPDRRRNELSDCKRGDQPADHPLGGVHARRVEGHERRDQHQAQHVDEADRHQHREPLHRLAPTPRTTALTSMSTTPNAAATPVSASRRLERISMDTGRVSYV